MKEELENYAPVTVEGMETHYGGVSTKLLVSVIEDEKQKVKIALPIKAIFELDSMVGDDILEKLIEKKIDLDAIVLKVLKEGALPQTLFHLKDENKEYLVKIE